MRPFFVAIALLLLIVQPGFDSEQITRINEHISYHRVWVSIASARTEIGYLKISQYSTHYSLAVAIPKGGIGTLETLEQMVRTNFALAGINANFFDKDSKMPIGLLIKSGVVLSTNYGRRAALYIDLFGEISFANPRVSLLLKTKEALLKIDDVNRPPRGNGLFLYTPDYALPIRAGAAKIAKIRDDRIVSIFESGLLIPDRKSTFVLAAGSARARLSGLTRGDFAKVIHILDPPNYLVREAISAGPMLIRNCQIVLDPQSEGFEPEFLFSRAARSAIALMPDGDLILLVALKHKGSAGMNLFELARFLRQLGAQDAMALDGGGSSAIAFRQGFNLRNIGGTRRIAAALVLFPR